MLLLCAIPIAILTRKTKRKKRELLQGLFDLAGKSGDKITEFDYWGNAAIGIGKSKDRLFFIKSMNELTRTETVDLGSVQKCRFINSSRVVSSSQNIIDKLELGFTSLSAQKQEIILEFYNAVSDSLALRDEVQLAGKWSAIANAEIGRLASAKN